MPLNRAKPALGEAAHVAGFKQDLGGGPGGDSRTTVVSVDPVWVTSSASSAAAVLSWASTSRSIAARCVDQVQPQLTTGSVTPVVSKARGR